MVVQIFCPYEKDAIMHIVYTFQNVIDERKTAQINFLNFKFENGAPLHTTFIKTKREKIPKLL